MMQHLRLRKKVSCENNISIDIASVQEEAKLEVLRVSDMEYVIESKKTMMTALRSGWSFTVTEFLR